MPKKIFPSQKWIREYRRRDLRLDVLAGMTTAVMLIPQALAYALLAGLPPIVGLYGSILPVIVYALLGTSRQLSVAPVALLSLMRRSTYFVVEPVSRCTCDCLRISRSAPGMI